MLELETQKHTSAMLEMTIFDDIFTQISTPAMRMLIVVKFCK